MWAQRCANQSFLSGGLLVNQLSRGWGLGSGEWQKLWFLALASYCVVNSSHTCLQFQSINVMPLTTQLGRDAQSQLCPRPGERLQHTVAPCRPTQLQSPLWAGLKPLLWLNHSSISPCPSPFSSHPKTGVAPENMLRSASCMRVSGSQSLFPRDSTYGKRNGTLSSLSLKLREWKPSVLSSKFINKVDQLLPLPGFLMNHRTYIDKLINGAFCFAL